MNGSLTLATGAVVLLALCAWLLRGRLDLVVEHARDGMRHAITSVLMLGTLTGTVWTFSVGKLSLSGVGEMLLSTGSIAAALEVGILYAGWHIGEIEARIHTTRRTDERAQLTRQRADLYRWFYGIVALSYVANLVYRVQTLHNVVLAAFVAIAPPMLVVFFAIKLRPLPRDYGEIGRRAAARALVVLTEEAGKVLVRNVRRMGRGHEITPAEAQHLQLAMGIIRIHTPGEQQQALDHVIAQQTPAGLLSAPGGVGDGQYLTAKDIEALYGVSNRSAQLWLSQTPGRRQRPHSNAKEAPASAIYAAHGVPAGIADQAAAAGVNRSRKRNVAQSGAIEAQAGVIESLGSAIIPQLAVYDSPSSAAGAQVLRNRREGDTLDLETA